MNDFPARLIVRLGPNPEKEYILAQPEITIGRSPGNTVAIANPEISRRHARIRREGDFYSIEDWGSTNGTFVSGQRIMGSTILHNGDEIRLGDSITFLFIYEKENTSPPLPVSYSSPNPELTIVDATPLAVPSSKKEPETKGDTQDFVQVTPKDEFILPEPTENTSRNRMRLFGCGCFVFLIPLLCIAILVFLDFYDQGRLLYCGPLRPFFEIFLGPLGFAPLCI